MRTRTLTFPGIIVVMLALLAWQSWGRIEASLRLSFADDQTQIIEDMAAKASAALDESPPDVQQAVASLAYVHNYYPSGTKQEPGTRLDRIVERSRSAAESRIIAKLRHATGQDLGDDADAWIQALGSP